MNKTIGHIAISGCGGFLNPPTHPEHNYSVQGRGFITSLSSAMFDEWLDDTTRQAAKRMIESWQAPAIKSADVQDWILQVLGYFKGCYKVAGNSAADCWHVDKLVITMTRNPMLNADLHAGVNFIRKYYPDFKPTAKQFKNAYWGKKKV